MDNMKKLQEKHNKEMRDILLKNKEEGDRMKIENVKKDILLDLYKFGIKEDLVLFQEFMDSYTLLDEDAISLFKTVWKEEKIRGKYLKEFMDLYDDEREEYLKLWRDGFRDEIIEIMKSDSKGLVEILIRDKKDSPEEKESFIKEKKEQDRFSVDGYDLTFLKTLDEGNSLEALEQMNTELNKIKDKDEYWRVYTIFRNMSLGKVLEQIKPDIYKKYGDNLTDKEFEFYASQELK